MLSIYKNMQPDSFLILKSSSLCYSGIFFFLEQPKAKGFLSHCLPAQVETRLLQPQGSPINISPCHQCTSPHDSAIPASERVHRHDKASTIKLSCTLVLSQASTTFFPM